MSAAKIFLYEPGSLTEAHILLGLLQSHGIDCALEGAYLAGGIGELPVNGLMRLLVSQNQFSQASRILQQYESGDLLQEDSEHPDQE
jgi:hypothetical protein